MKNLKKQDNPRQTPEGLMPKSRWIGKPSREKKEEPGIMNKIEIKWNGMKGDSERQLGTLRTIKFPNNELHLKHLMKLKLKRYRLLLCQLTNACGRPPQQTNTWAELCFSFVFYAFFFFWFFVKKIFFFFCYEIWWYFRKTKKWRETNVILFEPRCNLITKLEDDFMEIGCCERIKAATIYYFILRKKGWLFY